MNTETNETDEQKSESVAHIGEPIPSVYDLASHGQQAGYIGPDMPVDEWKGDHLAFTRPDGSAILF